MPKLMQSRLRRARQTRAKIAELKIVRLAVHRSNCHIYAQVIDNTSGKVLTSASTLESEVRKEVSKKRKKKKKEKRSGGKKSCGEKGKNNRYF